MEQINERWTAWRVAKYVAFWLGVFVVFAIVGGLMAIGFLLWLAGDLPPAPLP